MSDGPAGMAWLNGRAGAFFKATLRASALRAEGGAGS